MRLLKWNQWIVPYYIMGKMIATCVIQGAEAPACFANAVADYLVYGEVKSKCVLMIYRWWKFAVFFNR